MSASDYPFIRCEHPKKYFNVHTQCFMYAPCGRCNACNNRKSNRYTFQCRLESKAHKYSRFITLTYANTFLPYYHVSSPRPYCYDFVDPECGDVVFSLSYYPDLRKGELSFDEILKKQNFFGKFPYLNTEHQQLFVKRLRNHIKRKFHAEIRVFVCGEYGPEHFRPHYHLNLWHDCPALEGKSGHTLGEFPEWTWPKSLDYTPTALDELTWLDYFVRTCWPFGINSTEIPRGDTSSYVSSYTNSGCPLPEVFRNKFLRPRVFHSCFLGQPYLKRERNKVYETSPKDFVQRSYQIGNVYREYRLWRSCYNVFYPRCKGYASKSSQERLFTYRLYVYARQVYPTEKLTVVASNILSHVLFYLCSDGKNQIPDFYPDALLQLVRYFYHSLGITDSCFDLTDNESFHRYALRIYSELLLSRHFCVFCCGSYSYLVHERIYRKITAFYDYLDQQNLTEWYEAQAFYMDSDFAREGDVVFFYNDAIYLESELQSNPLYGRFVSMHKNLAYDKIKHKKANDFNNRLI